MLFLRPMSFHYFYCFNLTFVNGSNKTFKLNFVRQTDTQNHGHCNYNTELASGRLGENKKVEILWCSRSKFSTFWYCNICCVVDLDMCTKVKVVLQELLADLNWKLEQFLWFIHSAFILSFVWYKHVVEDLLAHLNWKPWAVPPIHSSLIISFVAE